MLRWQTSVWLFHLIATATAFHYECLPYPVRSVCIIEHILYRPGDQISFPVGYQQYHIKVSSSLKKATSKVSIFDDELYEAMHRPSSIEMTNTELVKLMLPAELLVGDFSNNDLATVNLSNEETYHITYLDLSFNRIRSMDFVSRLVNLEILHLKRNALDYVTGDALSMLTKLKYLYLQYNSIVWISWFDIPRSIIHLDCYLNAINRANFTDVDLPSLEYLNVQYNELSELNVTDLLRAAPNLKEAHLYNNHINRIKMSKIMAELTSNNVSFEDWMTGGWCTSDEEYDMDYGICIQRQEESLASRPIREILLTITVIGFATLFVCILVLVYRHMNR